MQIIMNATNTVIAALKSAQSEGQISAVTFSNASRWLETKQLPVAITESLNDLIEKSAWAEIEDRFYKGIAFGTGGMRGRTVGRVSASNEIDSHGQPIRAAVGSACLNDVNILRAGLGLWKHVSANQEKPRLVIAHDVRHFSKHFAELLASAWIKLGGEAFLFSGPRSTPQLSFTLRHLEAHAGVVITASHNPSHDNGFKCYLHDGGQVTPPADTAIVDLVGKIEVAEVIPFLEIDLNGIQPVTQATEEAYLNRLVKGVIDPEIMGRHAPSVVYTNLHGTGDVMVIPALRRLGIDPHVVEEQREHDGRFPTVPSPNPENPAAYVLALKLATELNADIVLATDPDADRVGVACRQAQEGYRLLTGNEVAALLTEFRISALKDNGIIPATGSTAAVVVKSLVTTPLVEKICHRHGVRCLETLVGFKWIARKLEKWSKKISENGSADFYNLPLNRRAPLALRNGNFFILGAEESYGYLSDDAIRDKDANGAVMMLCEYAAILRSRGRTLLDALDALHLAYGAHVEDLLNISFEGAEGAAAIRRIVSSWRNTPPKEIDGVKVIKITDYDQDKVMDSEGEQVPREEFIMAELADGSRIAVRASGTEPKVKFYTFTSTKTEDADDLKSARARAKKQALSLRTWLEADAQKRAKTK
jgi:phosphoglucomutase